jgi:DNA-binding CsgD family transcriptional regulator
MSDNDVLVLSPPVPSLVRWGCSPDADLVYRELVHGGPRPAGDLARRLGLPTRRVRDALQELETVQAVDALPAGGAAHAERRRCPRPQREVLDHLTARRIRPPGERGYLEVARPSVVHALGALFDRQWAIARDPREDDMPHISLTTRERSLVRLLAQGHTDTTAAREMHISPRSVTNTLRALMDQLGVENRFQLGLTLGALRVVEAPSSPPGGRGDGKEE